MTMVVFLAGATVGLAGRAAADEFLGVYRFQGANGDTSKWTVVPCGLGCVNVGVTDTSGFVDDRFIGQAHLENGQWSMTVDLLAAVQCDLNQRTYPGRFEYAWDSVAMSGTVVTVETFPNCGTPVMTRSGPRPFILTNDN
ncbi:hypothetical protein [[Mycobacterium] nativiensis]|uniref:Secreted protein n=1 Tax=[Mycobacterium] nativiensis TaxID=2855503 RepID=A0ABU5Y1P1_9MYCO|nr:hypothetical protein [Mycolicibacter sp. MYC340]MEB3034043.1 hypothetical protein [Mycolicibacter sp. MYC340]